MANGAGLLLGAGLLWAYTRRGSAPGTQRSAPADPFAQFIPTGRDLDNLNLRIGIWYEELLDASEGVVPYQLTGAIMFAESRGGFARGLTHFTPRPFGSDDSPLVKVWAAACRHPGREIGLMGLHPRFHDFANTPQALFGSANLAYGAAFYLETIEEVERNVGALSPLGVRSVAAARYNGGQRAWRAARTVLQNGGTDSAAIIAADQHTASKTYGRTTVARALALNMPRSAEAAA